VTLAADEAELFMATIPGTSGDDLLTGTAGNDLISGFAGADTIDGAAGNDTLDGGSGIDSIDGGGGRDVFRGTFDLGDTIDGGDGFDRVVGLSLSWTASPVMVDTRNLLNLLLSDGTTSLWIQGIEQFSGLATGSGDDVVHLGFVGESFVTSYRAGDGSDLLSLDFSGTDHLGRHAAAVTLEAPGPAYARLLVLLSDGTTLAPVRLYRDIETLQVTGSDGADLLHGMRGADTLRGNAGRDTLVGLQGADALWGGVGADTLQGGPGNDLLDGGTGADRLVGGTGNDIAVYLDATRAVIVDLGLGSGTAGEASGDVLVGIEGVVGSTFGDRITGSDLGDSLYGGDGPDTILGMAGDDLIQADSGPVFPTVHTLTREMSILDGGAGNDTIWGGTQTISTSEPGYYQPASIVGGDGDDVIYNGLIVDAGAGNDSVYGGNINSTIDTGTGNDTVEATYGNHTVHGGDGRDYVWTEALHGGTNVVDLGPGDDVGAVWSYDPQFAHRYQGGPGTDGFVFATDGSAGAPSLTTAVTLDLRSGGELALGTVRISGFERLSLLLGGEHDDSIRLGPLDDFVRCGGGDDVLAGRGGADFLDGGYGANTVLGGAGNDVLVAGSSQPDQAATARGGLGNDVLYGNFSSADFSGVARLHGDAGKDIFTFLPGGIYTPDRVMDFDPADDRVALYAGGYYFVDPTARAFTAIVPMDIVDTASVLRFSYIGAWGEWSEQREIEVRYDKSTGGLSLRADGDTDWIRVATLEGAPALSATHFLTLMEASSAGAADTAEDSWTPAVGGGADGGWLGGWFGG
jgi:Ca2+-binding RTX toxin-like protein